MNNFYKPCGLSRLTREPLGSVGSLQPTLAVTVMNGGQEAPAPHPSAPNNTTFITGKEKLVSVRGGVLTLPNFRCPQQSPE